MYYDRQGFPIPGTVEGNDSATRAWAHMMETMDRTVARDDLPDGSCLSTVWLGLDHGHGIGPPLIFETMRFAGELSEMEIPRPLGHGTMHYRPSLEFPDIFGEPDETTEQLRYSTEEEAFAAHHEIVRRLRIREGH